MELTFSGIYAEPSTLLYTRFDHLYSSTASLWAERAAEQVYAPLQQLIYDQEIIHHTRVVHDVSLTLFENGINVLVNFTENDALYENRVVPGLDFIWWRE
jgi:hypothetical protein